MTPRHTVKEERKGYRTGKRTKKEKSGNLGEGGEGGGRGKEGKGKGNETGRAQQQKTQP